MEIRKLDELDQAALEGKLPPIEWHINNLLQLINRLKADGVETGLFEGQVYNIIGWYQKFLNSYDKKERIDYLANCRDSTKNLCALVRSTKLEKYTPRCGSWVLALHDFALGIAAVCKITNCEPYTKIYDHLEKII